MKASADKALSIGWNAEAFARTKRMKPLGEYLKPAPSPEGRRAKGTSDVKRMLDRMIAKQKKEGG